ncbi:MAG: metal-dependent transcriptional regulator, partial [Hadesarchaea archaeon]
LLEFLLHRLLGYDSQTACKEASSFPPVSTPLADSLCRALGHPSTCPCGKPIEGCGGK